MPYDLSRNEKQKEFIRYAFKKGVDVLFYGGAAGGGKTFCWAMFADMYCYMVPNSFILVIRDTYSNCELTCVRTMREALPFNWGEGWEQQIRWHGKDHTFTYPNGSVIKFVGENYSTDKDLSFLNGLNPNVIVLEECDELQEKLLYKSILRAGRNFQTKSKALVICTCNPNQAWPKKVFYERQLNGTLPSNWHYITALPSDNGFMRKEYAAKLTEDVLGPKMYRRMVLGDWTDFDIENRWAYMYDEDKHSASNEQRRAAGLCDIVIDDKTQQAVSLDFNVDIMAGIVAQINRQKKQLWIHKDFSPCLGLEERIESIKSDEFTKKCLSRIIVTGDASDGRSAKAPNVSFYQDLQKGLRLSPLQLQVGKVNPTHADSRNEMESVFHKWDVWVSPECAELIADLKFTQTKMDGSSGIDKAKRDPHRLDCFRYLVHNLIAQAGLL